MNVIDSDNLTVEQFLKHMSLISFDWFYCLVILPEDKVQEFNATWECSPLVRLKKGRDETVIKDFMDFWGKRKILKALVIKPGAGAHVTGKNLDGMGMIIYVDYEEGVFE